MRGGNEAEAVITFRANNEASEEIKDVREQTEGAEKGFAGLSRGMIGAGLGFLGLSFGAKEVVDNFRELNKSQAKVDLQLGLLGDAAQQAYDDMRPAFKGIGDDVAATEREVSEAFATIIANSGGIAPSIAELKGAFDLAVSAGIPLEQAAAAIGQALQGNLEPLEQLLDPSGRKSVASLSQVLNEAGEAAETARTPIDSLTKTFRELSDEVGKAVNIAAEDPFGSLITGPVMESVAEFDRGIGLIIEKIGLAGLLAKETEGSFKDLTGVDWNDPLRSFKMRVPGGGLTGTNMEFLSAAAEAGVIPGFGATTPVPPFTINVGSIDSEARLNELARRLETIIRNNNRNGTNVGDK